MFSRVCQSFEKLSCPLPLDGHLKYPRPFSNVTPERCFRLKQCPSSGSTGPTGVPFEIVVKINTPDKSLTIPFFVSAAVRDTNDIVIDWGDNKSQTVALTRNKSVKHTYDIIPLNGEYTVKIFGNIPHIVFSGNLTFDPSIITPTTPATPPTPNQLQLIKVNQWGDGKWTSFNRMFAGCQNLTSVGESGSGSRSRSGSVPNLSTVTSMTRMFSGCNKLEKVNLSSWNTSNVTDMRRMFYDCASLIELDLLSFDTSKVTSSMNSMFSGCSMLSELNLSSFNTSKVINMAGMFYRCSMLTTLTLSDDFKTGMVTSMVQMFDGCSQLTELDLSSFDTSMVANMYQMFNGCSLLNSDLSGWDFSKVTDARGMLDLCGMDVDNYDALLENLALTALKPGVTLGAEDLIYSEEAEENHNTVISQGWTITGDMLQDENQLINL